MGKLENVNSLGTNKEFFKFSLPIKLNRPNIGTASFIKQEEIFFS